MDSGRCVQAIDTREFGVTGGQRQHLCDRRRGLQPIGFDDLARGVGVYHFDAQDHEANGAPQA